MKRILCATALGSIFACANAGDFEGKIADVFVHNFNDAVVFSLTTANPNFHNCAVSQRYGFSTVTQSGRNLLSAVLSAKAAQKTIYVAGWNKCEFHGDAEDVMWLSVR